ncbi:MAG: phosphoglycerate kinase [Candidatus Marinimicrobia bacterium]|nr:phosphoglycerate kinase [Candidatus Neomarinimicrobiota bacterium]
MAYLTIDDLNVKGKKVLMRVDFNVPLDANQKITDDFRIVSAIPSIKKLVDEGAKVILMSHLGRPDGEKKEKLSLKPIAERLQQDFDHVAFVPDCIGPIAEEAANNLRDGAILLLENLRFYKEEQKNNPEFAAKLARLGDIYVNDAFGTSHRPDASMAGVCEFFEQRAAGYLLEKELKYLGEALNKPKTPYTAILGGAKVSDKIEIIKSLMPKVQNLIIGGGMSFTFLKAQGYEIGKSLLEGDKLELAKEIMAAAEAQNCKIYLPVDAVVASEVSENASADVVMMENFPKDKLGLDISTATEKVFGEVLENSKTVLWNGPMGVFEIDQFSKGTEFIARKLAEITAKGAITVIGGGDSAAAIKKFGLSHQVSHVSTGGGASLEMISGEPMIPLTYISTK